MYRFLNVLLLLSNCKILAIVESVENFVTTKFLFWSNEFYNAKDNLLLLGTIACVNPFLFGSNKFDNDFKKSI